MSEQTLKELMVTNVLIVHLADSMEEVFPKISDQPDRYVVVLDDEDVPLYITTGDEMKRKMPRSLSWPVVGDFAARLPEALLADENAAIDQAMVFFGMMSQLEPQPEGLVVMRDTKVVGILPYSALVDYFHEQTIPELKAAGQIVRRAGQPVTVANAVFRCRRYPRCSFEITADLIDKPPLCGVQAAHGRTRLQA